MGYNLFMAAVEVLLSTGSLYTFPLEKSFYLANRAGFDGVELMANEVYRRPKVEEYLRALSRIAPIRVIHAPFVVDGGSGEKINSLLRSVELAQRLEISKVVFHPPRRFPPEVKYLRWFRGIKDFSQVGQGVALSLEVMPAFPLGGIKVNLFSANTREGLASFAEERNLNITMDTTHTGTWGWDLVETFCMLNRNGLVNHIHFSDFAPWKEHLWPGKGCLELRSFVDFLKRAGYRESISLEVHPRELPEDDLEKIKAFEEIISWVKGKNHG